MERNFNYKGVSFKIIKNGKNALMLYAKADFLTSPCIEVWMKKESKDRFVNGKLIKGGLRKPNNNDYPYTAHQFILSHFESREEFLETVKRRFEEYESGVRPKSIKQEYDTERKNTN